VQTVDFNAVQRRLTIHVDFAPGSRFAHPKAPGEHPGANQDGWGSADVVLAPLG
jgi:hypothetical protein